MSKPLEVRPFSTSDYLTLCAWWSGFDSAPPPLQLLPLASAYVACRKDKPLAYSHVWLTNASVAIIGLTICDPALTGVLRTRATLTVLEKVIEVGKAHAGNGGCLWSCTDNPGLVKMYQRKGFTNAGDATTFHMALGSFNPEFLE